MADQITKIPPSAAIIAVQICQSIADEIGNPGSTVQINLHPSYWPLIKQVVDAVAEANVPQFSHL